MPAMVHSGVDLSLYVSNNSYGGPGDQKSGDKNAAVSFTNCRGNTGVTIKTLTAYTDTWQLAGLDVKFSDGKFFQYGYAGGDTTRSFTFQDGETVVELTMYDSHKKSDEDKGFHSGGFEFKTSASRSFKVEPKKSPKHSYHVSVGSGIMCGVFGSSDTLAIDNLGFAVLQKIDSALLTDVSYPALSQQKVNTPPTNVNYYEGINNVQTHRVLTSLAQPL